MAGTPIKLTLYDRETAEEITTHVAVFVPWKLLKLGIRLSKRFAGKNTSDLEDADIDELTNYILAIFPSKLTAADLEEHADVSDMLTVLNMVVGKARGAMDPTLPT